jgi:hypothetical protein
MEARVGVAPDNRSEPTAAERIRSVVVAADSLTVTANCHRSMVVGPHSLDDQGRLDLLLPTDCHLATQIARVPGGALDAVAEFTDVAPTTHRDRVRARVTLAGPLTPCSSSPATSVRSASGSTGPVVEVRLDTTRATLDTAAGTVDVPLDALAQAATDPVATREAALLTHLVDAHADIVGRLTRLADPQVMYGVTRVAPLAIDRYGIVLRLERAHGHSDVRLPFPTPLDDVGNVGVQVHALLAAARACPRHRRLGASP